MTPAFRKYIRGGAATLCLLGSAAAGNAQTAAFSVTGTPVALANPPQTLGFAFTTSQAFTISALGIYDFGGDGLNDSHEVGLFSSSGDLLLSTVMQAGTSAALVDGFRYNTVSPYALAAGSYRIGALYTSGRDRLFFETNPNIVTSITGFTYDGARNGLNIPTLTDPTRRGGGTGGYLGPNLLVSPLAAVPEPSAWALLILGFGATGGAMRRIKPRKAVRRAEYA